MAKLIYFVSLLIFIDILFLITGQLNIESPSSIIIKSILDPSNILTSNLWELLITGLSGLALTAGVISAFVTRSSDILVFVTMGTALALLIGDYVTILNYLYEINKVLATIVLVPIIVIFPIIIVAWVRGND